MTGQDLRRDHKIKIIEEELSLTSFSVEPKFGIGQRAFLIRSDEGNILWDCISLLDDVTAEQIAKLGGLAAIAISHPHYYTSMVEWSAAFGGVPVYLHEDDKRWVMRPHQCIRFWDGETLDLPGNLKLIRCRGHFQGACVLHWPDGCGGRGVLLTGDTIQVTSDRKWVSFMYSYPNYIPLNAPTVKKIVEAVRPFAFDRIYGAFPDLTIQSSGKEVIERSAERYLNCIASS